MIFERAWQCPRGLSTIDLKFLKTPRCLCPCIIFSICHIITSSNKNTLHVKYFKDSKQTNAYMSFKMLFGRVPVIKVNQTDHRHHRNITIAFP